jgi:type II secretory pathway pseudopilin PulG
MSLLNKNNRSRLKNNRGLTLPELLISAFILAITFVGMLYSFTRAMALSEMARNSTTAVQAVKSRVEQVKNTNFNQVVANYNNTTFTTNGLTGTGVTYATLINANLIEVRAAFCWREKGGRIIGEDINLNGALDAGEVDANNNGFVDSIVGVVTSIYNE